MKIRTWLVLISCCLLATTSSAGIDQSTNNSTKVKQKQLQGQAQGQIGINKAVGTGNSTDSNVNVSEGDTDVYAPSWASTPSTVGKDEKSVFSLWGGINKNELSVDKKLDWYRGVVIEMREHNIITEKELIKELRLIYKIAKKYISPDKFLGLFPMCDNVIVNTIGCF